MAATGPPSSPRDRGELTASDATTFRCARESDQGVAVNPTARICISAGLALIEADALPRLI